jgi:hypothetical protein
MASQITRRSYRRRRTVADIEKLLSEREKQHGDYKDVSRISQSLKEVFRSGPNWEKLPDMQKESLELIASKIARILSGDSGVRDHWDDIGGYAGLGSRYGSSPTNVSFDLRKAIEKAS